MNRYRNHWSWTGGAYREPARIVFVDLSRVGSYAIHDLCPGFCTVALFPLSKLGVWAAREQPLPAMKWIYQYTHIYLPIVTGNLHCVSQLPSPSVEEEPSFNTSILAILRITCGSKKWLVCMLQTSQQVHILTWYQLSSICKCHQLSNCQPTNFEFQHDFPTQHMTSSNNHFNFNEVVSFRSRLSTSNLRLSVSPIWPCRR